MSPTKEPRRDTPDDGGDKKTTIDTEHFKHMVEALKDGNQLLNLPRATFHLLIPYLGNHIGAIISVEIDHHMVADDDDWGRYSCYRDDSQDTKLEDFTFLATFPGHAGDAVMLLLRDENAPHELDFELEQCDIWWFFYYANKVDGIMLNWLDDDARYDLWHKLPWDPQKFISSLKKLRQQYVGTKGVIRPEEGEDKDEAVTITQENNSVFRDCYKFVRAWHSREIGTTLAFKLAGHAPPPELCEMIATNFYDEEVLKGF